MTPDELEREKLLDRVQGHVREHGIPALKIESIAASFAMSADRLHEYFSGETELIAALVARNRARLRETYARMDASESLTSRQKRKMMWDSYFAAADDGRIFFEAYGLAMHDQTYGAFLHGINDWLYLMAETMTRRGISRARATTFATLTLAVYRGAMLDYCVTRDRGRVSAAMELWLDVAERFDAESA
jgi:AcrR family transcriptional regulator